LGGGGSNLVDGRDKGVHDPVLEGAEHQAAVGDVGGGKAGGVLQVALALVSDLQDRDLIAVLHVSRSLHLQSKAGLGRKAGIDSCQPMAVKAHSGRMAWQDWQEGHLTALCENSKHDASAFPISMQSARCSHIYTHQDAQI